MEDENSEEKLKPSAGLPAQNLTLQKAIDLGEYDPEFLSGFAQWHNLSPHAQLQMIRQGIDNRKRQLDVQWAEINNVLYFSQKPELQIALRNIEKQHKKLSEDRERIYLEYSDKF